ncbi:MAG TPA: S1 RNA-binding domain-containing protein [Candidatus Krumholzibacteria bacterium]|nr:S1 RNA-binding domain-containing protein [Candidatus Krumholzibacteria bacterium]
MTDDLRSDGLPEIPAEPTPDTPAAPDAAFESGEDFAAMLAADDARRASGAPEPKPGDKITGKVVQIAADEVFVDYGGRGELPLSSSFVKDADGNLTVKEGDEITAFVTGKPGDLRLELKRKLSGKDPKPLQEAMASGVPLAGRVTETNKGGFVVDLGGWRAFCPISQIDDRYVEDPNVWVGRDLEFRVIEFSEGGRRLVVSRRAILAESKQERAAETRKRLHPGVILQGTVARLLPFGAFIDIGGVEGLVHVSEISHARVSHPGDALKEGQEVEVKVMDIQNLGRGKEERISLSMKALAGNPWDRIREKYNEGDWVEGVVVGLAPYGAFVELEPGLTGLVHISALSSDRIEHPADVVQEGQQVSVRVIEVDPARQRISLSITS